MLKRNACMIKTRKRQYAIEMDYRRGCPIYCPEMGNLTSNTKVIISWIIKVLDILICRVCLVCLISCFHGFVSLMNWIFRSARARTFIIGWVCLSVNVFPSSHNQHNSTSITQPALFNQHHSTRITQPASTLLPKPSISSLIICYLFLSWRIYQTFRLVSFKSFYDQGYLFCLGVEKKGFF